MRLGIRLKFVIMKIVKCLLVFLLIVFCQENKKAKTEKKAALIHSKIDSLNTEAQVQQFVRENNTNFKKFELRKIANFNRVHNSNDEDSLIKILAKKLKIDKSFYKADIDSNGLTDLVVIGDNYTCETSNDNNESVSCDFSVFALMNFGKYSILYKDLEKDHRTPIVPKIDKVNGIPILSISNVEYDYDERGKQKIRYISTVLAYKYGAFIEYQKQKEMHSIEKIEFSASACYGECPIFKLELTKDNKAVLWAEAYNYNISYPRTAEEFKKRKELKGKYNSIITHDKYNEIIDLINYLNIEKLEKSYTVYATDNPSSLLKITYDNGKVKSIDDYGINGTRGLTRLYDMLFDLRFNQKWNQVSKQVEVKLY